MPCELSNCTKVCPAAARHTDFINKLEGALQELDETSYWLELLVESGIVKPELLTDLQKETDELIAIFISSVKTAKSNRP